VRIRFLGTYSGESKDHKLVTFLIDDVIAVEAATLASELTFAEQRQIRAILLSHCHYDHVRDLPAFAFNSAQNGSDSYAEVLSLPETLQAVATHFFNGVIYPNYTDSDSYLGKPAIEFRPTETYRSERIEGYRVVAVPVKHNIGAVGFEITSEDGKNVFYSGDTGPGLSHLWERISPQLIIADTTFPNRLMKTASDAGHLCPDMLKRELQEFRRTKGYLPRVILVHLNPEYASEIRIEAESLAKDLSISIATVRDGETVVL